MDELRMRGLITFEAGGKREHQEDAFKVNKDRGIAVVADGFGGPVGGREAADKACEGVLDFLQNKVGDLDATLPFEMRKYFTLGGNILFNALLHANHQLMRRNEKFGIHEKGGASVVAGYLMDGVLSVANIGVCEAYLFRQKKVIPLVSPRTYGRFLDPFSRGRDNTGWDIPLSALGVTDDMQPELVEMRAEPEDWVLFTTDGMTPVVLEDLQQGILNEKSLESGLEIARDILECADPSDNLAISLFFIG